MQLEIFLGLLMCLIGGSCLAEIPGERFKKEEIENINIIDLSVPDVISYISVVGMLSGVGELHVETNFNVPTIRRKGAHKFDSKTVVQNYARTIEKKLQGKQFLFQNAKITLSIKKINYYDLLRLVSQMTGLFISYKNNAAILSAFPSELSVAEYECSDDLAFAFRGEPLDRLVFFLTGVCADEREYFAEVKDKRLFLVASEELHRKMKCGLKEWNESRVQKPKGGGGVAQDIRLRFGETIKSSGTLIDKFTFWWSSKPRCPITELNEYEFRLYNQDVGKWLSRDLIGERFSINLSSILSNNGVSKYDVLGLAECPCSQEDIDTVGRRMSKIAANNTSEAPWEEPEKGVRIKPEYCGRICCDNKTKTVSSTGPIKGVIAYVTEGNISGWKASCDLTGKIECPKGTSEEVGIYHSHPEDGGGMSGGDKGNECIYLQVDGKQMCWRWRKTPQELCSWSEEKKEWVCQKQ